jgi:hypothetical protein
MQAMTKCVLLIPKRRFMRDLTKTDKNILKIHDGRSDTDIELYYRNPTTQEEVAYQSKLFRRQGKKLLINAYETRLEMGLKILTGFREGAFGISGKPISSDPQSPEYRKDWKELLKENASDIITALAFQIFESARVDTGMDIDFGTNGIEEVEAPPFLKS